MLLFTCSTSSVGVILFGISCFVWLYCTTIWYTCQPLFGIIFKIRSCPNPATWSCCKAKAPRLPLLLSCWLRVVYPLLFSFVPCCCFLYVYCNKYSLICQGQSVTILRFLRNKSMCDCPSNHANPSTYTDTLRSICAVTDVVEELCCCHVSIIYYRHLFVKIFSLKNKRLSK